MTNLTRRAALRGIAAGGAAVLAGCTGGGDPVSGGNGGAGDDGGDGGDSGDAGNNGGDSGDAGNNGGDSGDAGDDGGDGGDGESDPAPETEVHQVGAALSGPAWSREERRGLCALITGEGDASKLLRDAPAETAAFVEETDFGDSVLIYVESVGPTTCHNEIAFEEIGVEDGTLVADAAVRGAGDYQVACGQAITYPAALLRVTSDPLPDAARLSVTDGWGETGTVRSGDGPLALRADRG
ncbi:hypothetical protein EXE45_02440 [Halorubrum sp. SP9]|nr:hypothetical protein EXE45_02440 [Halorubrum sp. SP9]